MNSAIESTASDIAMSVFASTDTGTKRKANQDAFLVADLTTGNCGLGSDTVEHPIGERGALLAVADGMGGAAAGEVASSLAVTSLCRSMIELPPGPAADERLIEAAERANRTIWSRSHADGRLAGMGTTLTAALIHEGSAHILQIGDSRAYLIRGSRIDQITKDQSLAQLLLDQGILSPAQAETYPRNVILQALGAEPHVDPALTEVTLEPGDYLLLCSDGLSNKVSDSEMRDTIRSSTNLTAACRRLIEMANERGGEDNITLIIACIEGADRVSDKGFKNH